MNAIARFMPGCVLLLLSLCVLRCNGLTHGHMDDWEASMTEIHEMSFAFDHSYWQDCLADESFFRMMQDSTCAKLWTYVLEHLTIREIGTIEPVITDEDFRNGARPEKPHQNGGVRCYGDATQGWFKPCYGNVPGTAESYFGEIISFHVDRILGTHRVLPVAPYWFSQVDLVRLAERDHNVVKPWKYHPTTPVDDVMSIIRHCGTDGMVEGAMIGWAPHPVKDLRNDKKVLHIQQEHVIRFSRRWEEDREGLIEMFEAVTNDASDEVKLVPLESVQFNMYCGITGYMNRWAHNVNVMVGDDGDYSLLLYLDNDRSNWRHSTLGNSELPSLEETPLATLCKFPRTVAENVLELASGNSSLSDRVRRSLSVYSGGRLHNGELLSLEDAAVMDENVANYATIINQCIAKHGREQVLITEPWLNDYSGHVVEPIAWKYTRSTDQHAPSWLAVTGFALLSIMIIVTASVLFFLWWHRRNPHTVVEGSAELDGTEMELLSEDEECKEV